MFRSTVVIKSPNLKFSTVKEFKDELEKYYNSYAYSWGIDNFEVEGKIITKTETLDNEKQLTIITNWDCEESYIEFYDNSINKLNALEADGYIRTVTTETNI